MSHTTTIKSLAIKDTRAIVKAVEELRAQGVNCQLLTNAVPRLYYQNQHGRCDYVVNLPGCRFDVGLDLQSDGSYAPVFDEHGGLVSKHLGVGKSNGRDAKAHIGKFIQAYAKNAAIFAAVDNGYVVTDVTTDQYDNIHLTVETGY